MDFPENVKQYGTIESSRFFLEGGLGFDFSAKSEVTLVIFNGLNSNNSASMPKRLNGFNRIFRRKLGRPINIMIIGDANRDFGVYSANYLGVLGICNNQFELANIINDKLYLKGCTRRTVAYANCGGSIPAILSSMQVPYHSLNLVTPYLKVFGAEHEFDFKSHSAWKAKEHSIWVHETLTSMSRWFDLTEFLGEYVQQPQADLHLHWARGIGGTDLVFREMGERFTQGRWNVKLHDHDVPPEVDRHMLHTWLVTSNLYYTMLTQLLHEQFAALGERTSLSPPIE